MTWFCSLLDLRCKLSPCCILQVQQARYCAFFGNVRRNQVTLPTVWLGSISWRFAVWWTGGSTSFWPIQLTVILKPPTPPMKVKSHEQKTELTMDNTVGFALQSFTVLSFAGAASLLIFPFGNVGRSQVTLLTKLPHLNSISFNFCSTIQKKNSRSFTIFDPERVVLHTSFKFGRLRKFKPNKHKTAGQINTRESIAPTTQFVFNLDGKVRHQLNSKFHKSKLYHQCHLSSMKWMELMISRNQNLQEWNWIKFEQMFEDNELYKDSQMISSHPRQIHKFEVIFYHREDSS